MIEAWLAAQIDAKREAGVAAHRRRMARWSDFDSVANRRWCDLIHRQIEPPREFFLEIGTEGRHWLTHNPDGSRKVTRPVKKR